MKVDEKLLKKSINTAMVFSVQEKKGKTPRERKFDESLDLIINLKDIDLRDPKQRIDKELILPKPISKSDNLSLCVIASGDILLQAKKMGVYTMNKEDIEQRLFLVSNQSVPDFHLSQFLEHPSLNILGLSVGTL